MNFDVAYGNIRQVQLKRLPVSSVVEGNENAEFSSGVKQSLPIRIFAHDACRPIGGDAILAVGQTRPGLSVIISEINVRLIVAEQPTIHGEVRRAFAMRRGI